MRLLSHPLQRVYHKLWELTLEKGNIQISRATLCEVAFCSHVWRFLPPSLGATRTAIADAGGCVCHRLLPSGWMPRPVEVEALTWEVGVSGDVLH